MKHETSFLAVNEIWRELLVVTSKSEIPDYPNGIITNTGEHYDTVYYTDGVFRSFDEGGQHINWYLIRSKEVRERATARLEAELTQTQLALAEIAGLLGGAE